MKEVIETSEAPLPIGPYSQAIRNEAIIYASGQLPIDPADGTIPGGVANQTRQSIENLRVILAQAGSSLDSVMKTTVYLTDMADFGEMNGIYEVFFTGKTPARTCVEVAKLPMNASVEIEAIAIAEGDK